MTVTRWTALFPMPLGLMPRSASDRREARKAAAGHRGEERLAGRPLVVPCERHLPHQRGVRRFEPLVAREHAGEPLHAERSQRMPLTWIDSVRIAIPARD